MALSEAMVRNLYAAQGEPTALLLTLQADGLDVPLYLTPFPDGITSRGQVFEEFPFNFAWGGAGVGEPARQTQIVIGNRDGRILQAIRTVTGQPSVTLELVRVSEPDLVEMAMTNAVLADAEDVEPRITGTLRPRRFDTEPACSARYTIARTPSLF